MLTTASMEDTFRVFEDPYNLAKITPPWLSFRVTSANRVEMRKDAEITYTIRWLGIPLRWKTVIREYQPPQFFVDEQVQGPYVLWRHQHTFTKTEGGTLVGDHVDYSLPFGLLGQIVHATVVKRQVLAIFEYRQRALAKLLPGECRQTLAPVVS